MRFSLIITRIPRGKVRVELGRHSGLKMDYANSRPPAMAERRLLAFPGHSRTSWVGREPDRCSLAALGSCLDDARARRHYSILHTSCQCHAGASHSRLPSVPVCVFATSWLRSLADEVAVATKTQRH
jgi:hypothetical protein